MNTIRKLVKFLIDIFLLNISLVISVFLKYDQLQMTSKNVNFLVYFNLSFCIMYFILKIYNNSWRFSGISEYTTLIILSTVITILSYMLSDIWDQKEVFTNELFRNWEGYRQRNSWFQRKSYCRSLSLALWRYYRKRYCTKRGFYRRIRSFGVKRRW